MKVGNEYHGGVKSSPSSKKGFEYDPSDAQEIYNSLVHKTVKFDELSELGQKTVLQYSIDEKLDGFDNLSLDAYKKFGLSRNSGVYENAFDNYSHDVDEMASMMSGKKSALNRIFESDFGTSEVSGMSDELGYKKPTQFLPDSKTPVSDTYDTTKSFMKNLTNLSNVGVERQKAILMQGTDGTTDFSDLTKQDLIDQDKYDEAVDLERTKEIEYANQYIQTPNGEMKRSDWESLYSQMQQRAVDGYFIPYAETPRIELTSNNANEMAPGDWNFLTVAEYDAYRKDKDINVAPRSLSDPKAIDYWIYTTKDGIDFDKTKEIRERFKANIENQANLVESNKAQGNVDFEQLSEYEKNRLGIRDASENFDMDEKNWRSGDYVKNQLSEYEGHFRINESGFLGNMEEGFFDSKLTWLDAEVGHRMIFASTPEEMQELKLDLARIKDFRDRYADKIGVSVDNQNFRDKNKNNPLGFLHGALRDASGQVSLYTHDLDEKIATVALGTLLTPLLGANAVKGSVALAQGADAFEIESGLAYLEYVDSGIPHEIAKRNALFAGAINGGIEVGETLIMLFSAGLGITGKATTKSLPMLTKMGSSIGNKFGKKAIGLAAEGLARYGLVVSGEVIQEGIQGVVTSAFLKMGIDEARQKGTLEVADIEDLSWDDVLRRGKDEMIASIPAMTLLAGLGSSIGTINQYRSIKRTETMVDGQTPPKSNVLNVSENLKKAWDSLPLEERVAVAIHAVKEFESIQLEIENAPGNFSNETYRAKLIEKLTFFKDSMSEYRTEYADALAYLPESVDKVALMEDQIDIVTEGLLNIETVIENKDNAQYQSAINNVRVFAEKDLVKALQYAEKLDSIVPAELKEELNIEINRIRETLEAQYVAEEEQKHIDEKQAVSGEKVESIENKKVPSPTEFVANLSEEEQVKQFIELRRGNVSILDAISHYDREIERMTKTKNSLRSKRKVSLIDERLEEMRIQADELYLQNAELEEVLGNEEVVKKVVSNLKNRIDEIENMPVFEDKGKRTNVIPQKLLNEWTRLTQQVEILENEIKGDEVVEELPSIEQIEETTVGGVEVASNVETVETPIIETPPIETPPIETPLPVVDNTDQIDMGDRTFKNVGSTKVKAYQTLHPELVPFFAKMAKETLEDMKKGTKGQIIPNSDTKEFKKVSRTQSQTVDKILKTVVDNYKKVTSILTDMSNGNVSDTAFTKRIEMIFNENMTRGYLNFEGENITPNSEYISAISKYEQTPNLESGGPRLVTPEESVALHKEIQDRLVDKINKSKFKTDIENVIEEINTNPNIPDGSANAVVSKLLTLVGHLSNSDMDIKFAVDFVEEISNFITQEQIDSHGLNGNTDVYHSGVMTSGYDVISNALRIGIEVATQSNSFPINDSFMHELGELWQAIWKQSNPNEYAFVTSKLIKDGFATEETINEFIADNFRNASYSKDIGKNMDMDGVQLALFKKVYDRFKRWAKGFVKIIMKYRKDFGSYPREYQKQLLDFANGKWDKALNRLEELNREHIKHTSVEQSDLVEHQSNEKVEIPETKTADWKLSQEEINGVKTEILGPYEMIKAEQAKILERSQANIQKTVDDNIEDFNLSPELISLIEQENSSDLEAIAMATLPPEVIEEMYQEFNDADIESELVPEEPESIEQPIEIKTDEIIEAPVEEEPKAKAKTETVKSDVKIETNQIELGDEKINEKTFSVGESELIVYENSPYAGGRDSIFKFLVPKELRKKGIGSRLLQEGIKQYGKNFSAQVSNENSVKVHYDNGFRATKYVKATDTYITKNVSLEKTLNSFKNSPSSLNMMFAGEDFIDKKVIDNLKKYVPQVESKQTKESSDKSNNSKSFIATDPQIKHVKEFLNKIKSKNHKIGQTRVNGDGEIIVIYTTESGKNRAVKITKEGKELATSPDIDNTKVIKDLETIQGESVKIKKEVTTEESLAKYVKSIEADTLQTIENVIKSEKGEMVGTSYQQIKTNFRRRLITHVKHGRVEVVQKAIETLKANAPGLFDSTNSIWGMVEDAKKHKERLESEVAKVGTENIAHFIGGEIRVNYDIDRIQIKFKPKLNKKNTRDNVVIDQLHQADWTEAPNNQAWQSRINEASRKSALKLIEDNYKILKTNDLHFTMQEGTKVFFGERRGAKDNMSDNNSPILERLGYYEDRGTKQWLEDTINRAKNDSFTISESNTRKSVANKVTATFNTEYLSPDFVFNFVEDGFNGELSNFKNGNKGSKYDRVFESINENGYDNENEIVVYVDWNGDAYVAEGNNRLQAVIDYNEENTDKNPITKIPVKTYYFDGGESKNTIWKPDHIVREMTKHIDNESSIETIDSVEFKKWFKDSVVTKDNEPMTMYHGSPNATFNEFDINKAVVGLAGKGFYFTDSHYLANGYANQNSSNWANGTINDILVNGDSITIETFQALTKTLLKLGNKLFGKHVKISETNGFDKLANRNINDVSVQDAFTDFDDELDTIDFDLFRKKGNAEYYDNIVEKLALRELYVLITSLDGYDQNIFNLRDSEVFSSQFRRFNFRAFNKEHLYKRFMQQNTGLKNDVVNYINNALKTDGINLSFDVDGNNSGVYEVYLSIQNPIDIDTYIPNTEELIELGVKESDIYSNDSDTTLFEYIESDEIPYYNIESINEVFERWGYDGITYTEGLRSGDRHRGYVAFSPNQIKSIFNDTFDPNNYDLRFDVKPNRPTVFNEIKGKQRALKDYKKDVETIGETFEGVEPNYEVIDQLINDTADLITDYIVDMTTFDITDQTGINHRTLSMIKNGDKYDIHYSYYPLITLSDEVVVEDFTLDSKREVARYMAENGFSDLTKLNSLDFTDKQLSAVIREIDHNIADLEVAESALDEAKENDPRLVRKHQEVVHEQFRENANKLTFDVRPTFEAILNRWFSGKDLSTLVNSVNVAKLQDRIKAITGEKYFGEDSIALDQALYVYIDLLGNEEIIDEFKDKLTDEQMKLVDASQNLSDEEKSIANEVLKYSEEIGTSGLGSGVLSIIRENHLSRMWKQRKSKNKNQSNVDMGAFYTKTNLAKKRKLGSVLEGWAKGMELSKSGATTALMSQAESVTKAIENKRFISALTTTRDYTGHRLLTDRPATGYAKINNPNFIVWRALEGEVVLAPFDIMDSQIGDIVSIDGQLGTLLDYNSTEAMDALKENHNVVVELSSGQNVLAPISELKQRPPSGFSSFVTNDGKIIEKREVFMREDFAKEINKILDPSALNKFAVVRGITKANSMLKKYILNMSLYHFLAFMRSYTIGTGRKGKGNHNWFTAYKKGLDEVKNLSDDVLLLVENGFTIGLIQDFDESHMYNEKTRLREFLSRKKYSKKVIDSVLGLRDNYTDFLFKRFGAGLKVQAGLIELKHLRNRYAAELVSGEITEQKLAVMISNMMNDDFGGLHLERMKRSKTAQHIMRLGLLAPDWTESNVKTIVKMFTGDEFSKAMYKRFWGRALLKGLGFTAVLNATMAMMDKDEDFMSMYKKAWDTGNLRWTYIDATPIWKMLGYDGMDRRYISLIGHFKDIFKFGWHPIRSAHHKASPSLKMVLELFKGTDWKGDGFTSFGDLIGLDQDTELGRVFKASTSDGKLKFQTTQYGRKGAVEFDQVISYLLHQMTSAQPIVFQNIVKSAFGEMHPADATLKSIGMDVASSYTWAEEVEFEALSEFYKRQKKKKDEGEPTNDGFTMQKLRTYEKGKAEIDKIKKQIDDLSEDNKSISMEERIKIIEGSNKTDAEKRVVLKDYEQRLSDYEANWISTEDEREQKVKELTEELNRLYKKYISALQ